MNQQRIINSALDGITRFNATKFPLKNVAQEVIKAKNLNSKERKVFLDLVFAWSRNRHLVRAFLAQDLKLFYAMSEHEKERLTLVLIAIVEFHFSIELDAGLTARFIAWSKQLGISAYSIALGPLISKHLKENFGDAWEELAEALWQGPKKYLAKDKSIDEEELIEALNDLGVKVAPHPQFPSALSIEGHLSLEELPKKFKDHVWFMDVGSQFIASLIKPKKDERVLDMCVGEGSKARIISSYPCAYFAVDINERRLSHAKTTLASHVQFSVEDATKLKLPKASFDWVFLDAPCSGSGVIRRHPDLIHRLSERDIASYLALQKNLLKSALTMLKPGGILIYATCSLFGVENQQQIDALLHNTKDLIPLPLSELLSGSELNNMGLDSRKNSFTLLPNIHDCDAFYCAAIRKVDSP